MKKVKALVLLSGGLDSILAAKVLMEQGIEVIGICFESNFFSADKARLAADTLGIKLIVKNIGDEIWGLVKNPPSGHGKNMNPCVDCHALMIKTAGEYVKKGEYDFLATGEVLGERPFSQNRISLDKVVKLAGVEVLRPLSAKLLPETEAEKLKFVDREKLLDISGRSRARQFELAEKYGLKEYPSPTGGCLLTDPAFSERLKELLRNWPDCDGDDIELLKFGRVFWLKFDNNVNSPTPPCLPDRQVATMGNIKKVLVVIGRDEQENDNLEKLAKKGDFVLKLKDITGPVAIVRIINYSSSVALAKGDELQIMNDIVKVNIPEKINDKEIIDIFTEEDKLFNNLLILTGYYSTKARGKEVKIAIKKINS
jgi:predicted subunit of tRNA(5-methylaminomethyl-2-thiouridylate) methyltransferase